MECQDWREYPDATPPSDAWLWSKVNSAWRKLPAKFRWDRAGIHFVLGWAVKDACGADGQLLLAITAAFLVYEVFESLKINDYCYPDVGGYMCGLLAYAFGLKAKLPIADWPNLLPWG